MARIDDAVLRGIDVAQQTLIFGANATIMQLHQEILQRAVSLDVPLAPESLEVTRDGARHVEQLRGFDATA